MMKLSYVVPLSIVAAVGCSTSKPRTDQPAQSSGYDSALNKAFAEINERAERAPAQSTAGDSGIALQDLNKVSPGKFKIYVFPKLKSTGDKNKVDDTVLYQNAMDEKFSHLGKPQEYEVSTIAENPCFRFIQGGLFANRNPKAFLNPSLAQDKKRRCAIVEITSMQVKNSNRALLRRDDFLRARLFLDDSYYVHGYQIEKYDDRRDLVTVQVKTSGDQSSASGLSLFPIDIPSLDIVRKASVQKRAVDVNTRIDKLALAQIQRRHMRDFRAATCTGIEANYTDYFGSRVQVGWCDGLPFPQYMENSRFVAVTQTLSVKR